MSLDRKDGLVAAGLGVFSLPHYVRKLLHGLKRLPGKWPVIAQGIAGMAIFAAALWPSMPSRMEILLQKEARWDFMQLPSNRELLAWLMAGQCVR